MYYTHNDDIFIIVIMKLFKKRQRKHPNLGARTFSKQLLCWIYSKGLISSAVLVREAFQQQNSKRGYNTKALD